MNLEDEMLALVGNLAEQGGEMTAMHIDVDGDGQMDITIDWIMPADAKCPTESCGRSLGHTGGCEYGPYLYAGPGGL